MKLFLKINLCSGTWKIILRREKFEGMLSDCVKSLDRICKKQGDPPMCVCAHMNSEDTQLSTAQLFFEDEVSSAVWWTRMYGVVLNVAVYMHRHSLSLSSDHRISVCVFCLFVFWDFFAKRWEAMTRVKLLTVGKRLLEIYNGTSPLAPIQADELPVFCRDTKVKGYLWMLLTVCVCVPMYVCE